jgi:hypothetical protein
MVGPATIIRHFTLSTDVHGSVSRPEQSGSAAAALIPVGAPALTRGLGHVPLVSCR